MSNPIPSLLGATWSRICAVWERCKAQNLFVIQQIWTNTFPPDDPKNHTLLEKILVTFPLLGRALSFSNLVALFRPGGRPAYLYIDLYLLAWVTVVVSALWYWSYVPILAVALVSYRVFDIVSYQLCIILVDSQKPSWKLASVRRSFLSASLNLTEIVVAFAVIYLVDGGIVENKTENPATISTPLLALYYSLVTLATLGYGEFIPKDDFSRGLVMLQIATEILFLLVVIPTLVSNIVVELGGRQWKDPEARP